MTKLLHLMWFVVVFLLPELSIAQLVAAVLLTLILGLLGRNIPHRWPILATVSTVVAILFQMFILDWVEWPSSHRPGFSKRVVGVATSEWLRPIISSLGREYHVRVIDLNEGTTSEELLRQADILMISSADVESDKVSKTIHGYLEKGGCLLYMLAESNGGRPSIESSLGIEHVVGDTDSALIRPLFYAPNDSAITFGCVLPSRRGEVKIVAAKLLAFRMAAASEHRASYLAIGCDSLYIDTNNNSEFDQPDDPDTRQWVFVASERFSGGGAALVVGCDDLGAPPLMKDNGPTTAALLSLLASRADLRLVPKYMNPDSVEFGDVVTLSADVENRGVTPAHRLSVGVKLPGEVKLLTWNDVIPPYANRPVYAAGVEAVVDGGAEHQTIVVKREHSLMHTRYLVGHYEEYIEGYVAVRDTIIGPIRMGTIGFRQDNGFARFVGWFQTKLPL